MPPFKGSLKDWVAYNRGALIRRPRGKTIYEVLDYERKGFGQQVIVRSQAGRTTIFKTREIRDSVVVMPRSTRGKGRPIRKAPRSTGREDVMSIDVQTLSRLRQIVQDSRMMVSRSLDTLGAVQDDLTVEVKANPEPKEVIGLVKDFRFRGGDVDERPRYTFKVDSNTGLIHWVSCTALRLEPIIRSMKVGKDLPKAMNGKLMLLGRTGELVPLKMLGLPLSVSTYGPNSTPSGYEGYITDMWDRWLFIGATVMDEKDLLLGTVVDGPLTLEDCTSGGSIYIDFHKSDEEAVARRSANLIRVDAT